MTGSKHFSHDPLEETLVIPSDLSGFADAELIMQDGLASIWHKDISTSHINLEFHTSLPCLCIVEEGMETFTDASGSEITVRAGEGLLIPADMYLLSDFESKNSPLRCYLFFFEAPLLTDVQAELAKTSRSSQLMEGVAGCFPIPAHPALKVFYESISNVYSDLSASRGLLRAKLTEALLLIDQTGGGAALHAFLAGAGQIRQCRNIKHVMRRHGHRNLAVSEYARMSGRPVSSFNRVFRREFGQSPKQWLKQQNLLRAKERLLVSDAAVTTIAHEFGYASASHFIEQFRGVFGQSPQALRESLRAEV